MTSYLDLRNQVLLGSRATFELEISQEKADPWGVIMDWGLETGSVTVVALSDGSASVYMSTGGGHIGGKSQESIRKAAKKMVGIAAELRPQMRVAKLYPLPKANMLTFYALTDEGVFTSSASVVDVSSQRSPLSKLGNAAQEIITLYQALKN